MTPKEKAKEFVEKIHNEFPLQQQVYSSLNEPMLNISDNWKEAKQCALIAVDEMIIQNGELYLNGLAIDYYIEKNAFLFAVKTEIENL